ncbi:MAG: helix-turn-helix domain-containing protein [Casimicrobiaceae bacterium]
MRARVATQMVDALASAAPLPPAATLWEAGRGTLYAALCNVPERCNERGLEPEEMLLERLVGRRIRLRKGEALFRAGEKFTSLYAVRSGSCKTVLPGDDGHDQVAGYHMAGDIIGTDGIGADRHDCEAIALEDMETCAMPFERLEDFAREDIPFQRSLNRLLSREITRERRITLILGTMHADQRLATFLLDLAQRYQERGYSSVEFVLRMTREEIGSYLGLKLETVSRLFSRFHEEGLIQVHGRVVKLIDRVALKRIVGIDGEGTCPRPASL